MDQEHSYDGIHTGRDYNDGTRSYCKCGWCSEALNSNYYTRATREDLIALYVDHRFKNLPEPVLISRKVYMSDIDNR